MEPPASAQGSGPEFPSAEERLPAHRRVLIVIEDGGHSHAAVVEGIEVARVDRAEVIFLQLLAELDAPVVDSAGFVHVPAEHLQQASQVAMNRRAAAALRTATKAGVPARVLSRSETLGGAGVAAIASEFGCDLIVAATDGLNAVERLLSGSLIPGLITAAHVPVLVCRGEGDEDTHERARRRPRRRNGPSPGPATRTLHGGDVASAARAR